MRYYAILSDIFDSIHTKGTTIVTLVVTGDTIMRKRDKSHKINYDLPYVMHRHANIGDRNLRDFSSRLRMCPL